jgi:hypothetical protein
MHKAGIRINGHRPQLEQPELHAVLPYSRLKVKNRPSVLNPS